MAEIKILKEEVVKKIAAGEVVERPASVLKELIENSLDAGATKIEIEVEKAGRRLIRVYDNGSGMQFKDLPLSIKRHSTSKISVFEDLERIKTFGFRGEALYSISSVSKIRIISSANENEPAHYIKGEGGKIIESGKTPPIKGTITEVRDLFFNTPARSKFLKSDQSERAHLIRCVEDAACANTDISFLLRIDGVEIYDFRAARGDFSQKLLERTKAILGKNISRDMIFVSEENKDVKVRCFISSPGNLCATAMNQYYFVNRRPVHSKTIRQAVYSAYERLRGNRHPALVLFVETEPENFDVNIHPQKKEIKFLDETGVFRFIKSSIARAIEKNLRPVKILETPENAPEEGGHFFSNDKILPTFPPPAGHSSVMEQVSLFSPRASQERSDSSKDWYIPPIFYLGQIAASYLIFESGRGLLVIEQHAAQERILYEEYISDFSRRKIPIQPMLSPVSAELSRSQIENLMRWKDWLWKAGFEVDLFGKNTVRMHAMPAVFNFSQESLLQFISYLSEVLGDPEKATEEIRLRTVATLACKKAVKARERIKEEEALRLVENLSRTKDSLHCPHGRPTLIYLSDNEIARKFQRPKAL